MAFGGGKYATAETDLMGQSAEDQFRGLLQSHGIQFRNSSERENRINHFDIVAFAPLADFSFRRPRIEVKSVKAARRGQVPDPSLLYVELKSVGGHPGWLYGDADLLAFQQSDFQFILVQRSDLKDWISKRVVGAKFGAHSGIKGTFWARPERNDLVFCVDTEEVKASVKHSLFEKKDLFQNYDVMFPALKNK